MRHITLVRHAQALFLAADYDNLRAKGETQARLLGKYWLRRGVIFQKAYSGPRVRQRETSRLVAEVYRSAGQSFPEIAVRSEFDEYPAQAVMRLCLPQLMQVNPEIRKLSKTYEGSSEPGERRRTFGKLFEIVISKWVTGETAADGIESWYEFCLRVERGIAQVLRDASPAASAVIFTSAGPIGATAHQVLHLSAEDTLHLSWMSRNASFSDFRASGHRLMLSAFIAHPHLDEDSLLTYW
ncbi:MAG TPA: histidine phosphatase family protein [Candidatus Acidoferrum sp.]|nr:histidine phosphatase family protein [Candidatus Acidoferrum sp.]